ncbi:restriction endonuclease subunit S [Marinococcus halotolerans]|uniref:restriction endonuclease subunit S n=1 Tax=Marinococcus halotolerans TaxID=301092 RepID=UPI0003B5D5C5|nr:restriction endonuclease subunit S [Marinococcus halotolerans]
MSKEQIEPIKKLLKNALVSKEEIPTSIPDNWIYFYFTSLLDVRGGTQPPKSDFENEPKEGYERLIQIRDFTSDNHKVFVPDTNKLRKVNKEDILIARYGASLGKILTGLQGAYNVALAKVVFRSELFESKYLYWLLKSFHFQIPLTKISRSAQSGFNKKDLSYIPLPLPPIEEQQRIVNKVEFLLSKVDEAKQLIDEARETFELRRVAIIDKALKGELTGKWRSQNIIEKSADEHILESHEIIMKLYEEECEIAKIEGKRPPKKPAIAKYFSVNRGAISNNEKMPKGWVNTTFSHLCILQRGFDLPTNKREEGKYPIVSAGGIIDFHNEYKISGPGVTTGRSGSIGNVFYIEEDYWPLNTSLFVESFNGNNKKFVYYYLENFPFESFSSSTAIPTLNRNNLMEESVSIPSRKEQDKIVEILDHLLLKEEIALQEILHLNKKLDLIKQTILSKAFKGKLGTNDPSEENIEQLLAKILEQK